MTQEIISSVLPVLTQLVVCTFFTVAINYLRHKIGKEKFDRYFATAYRVVTGIEQRCSNGHNGEAKKNLARVELNKLLGSKVSPADVDNLIETAVFEMNASFKRAGLLPVDKVEPIKLTPKQQYTADYQPITVEDKIVASVPHNNLDDVVTELAASLAEAITANMNKTE